MGENHWMITRPKRKLILVPELLKFFNATAVGKNWERNRETQLAYEQALTDAEWKAQNISKDGSGGRTYAALLYMLGLWYENPDGVRLTLAGQEIIEGVSPVIVLTKQLLTFQYPSAYSSKRNVNVSKDFKIRPYRFILNLFLEKKFTEITQDEIAFCLVPYAKKEEDLNSCAELITEYRKSPDSIIEKAIKDSGTTKDNLLNIGNTAVNEFLYTGYFIEGDETKSLRITDEGIKKSIDYLQNIPKEMIRFDGDVAKFQKKYGIGTQKSKDYSDSIRTQMEITPNVRKVMEQFFIISSREPVFGLTEEIIHEVKLQTGENENIIRQILNKLSISALLSDLKQTFLHISVGGQEFAKEFERKTTSFFVNSLNIPANWVGSRARHPDIILYIDREKHRHGIIDTKAYREYNLPLDHKNKMAFTYIPNFKYIEYLGERYTLEFFGYIAGGFSNNMDKSFAELVKMTEIAGHYINASTFLSLLDSHEENPMNSEEMINLFTINREITYEDLISRRN